MSDIETNCLLIIILGILMLGIGFVLEAFQRAAAIGREDRELLSRIATGIEAQSETALAQMLLVAKGEEAAQAARSTSQTHLHNIDARAELTNSLLQWIGDNDSAARS